MSDPRRHINPLLLLTAILLCLISGVFLRYSAYSPNPYQKTITLQELIGSLIPADSVDDKGSDNDEHKTEQQTTTITPTAAPTVTPQASEISSTPSPQAASGTWTSSGSNWIFLVDGQAYTGWLIDTDGKHYFFDEDGIMQTGWLDDNNKRYYLDPDGIMQTGHITVDGQEYELLSDGTLKENS